MYVVAFIHYAIDFVCETLSLDNNQSNCMIHQEIVIIQNFILVHVWLLRDRNKTIKYTIALFNYHYGTTFNSVLTNIQKSVHYAGFCWYSHNNVLKMDQLTSL